MTVGCTGELVCCMGAVNGVDQVTQLLVQHPGLELHPILDVMRR